MTVRIPWGYGTEYVTIDQARGRLLAHYHPEYVERLCAWLTHKNGSIGIGGHFRSDGTQPDKPGFAPEGKSFHQNQQYADGFVGACAVDLVAPDGPDGNNAHDGVSWAMTIPQGSQEALKWGLHCNVGFPPTGEPWHIQPIEIDGWDTWRFNGSPAPRAGYPFPGRFTAPGVPDVFYPLNPYRNSDTRVFGGPGINPKQDHEFGLDPAKIPANAVAVAMNIAAVPSGTPGWVSVFPGNASFQGTSVVNFDAGGAHNGAAIVGVSGGKFKVRSNVPVHVVIDITGYWTS